MRIRKEKIRLILMMNRDDLNCERSGYGKRCWRDPNENIFFWSKIILNGGSDAPKKMLNVQKTNDGVIFKIKVQAGAAKNEIVGAQEDALKIKINAPPVKGKANKALVDFLAEKLSAKRSEIEIISGHTSKIKKIKVVGEGMKIKERIQSLSAPNP